MIIYPLERLGYNEEWLFPAFGVRVWETAISLLWKRGTHSHSQKPVSAGRKPSQRCSEWPWVLFHALKDPARQGSAHLRWDESQGNGRVSEFLWPSVMKVPRGNSKFTAQSTDTKLSSQRCKVANTPASFINAVDSKMPPVKVPTKPKAPLTNDVSLQIH